MTSYFDAFSDGVSKLRVYVSRGYNYSKDKLSYFSYSELSTLKLFLCLVTLIVSSLFVITQSLNNPISTLPVIPIIPICIVLVFIGHLYSIQLAQDKRWKVLVFYLPIFTTLFQLIYSAGSIQLESSTSLSFMGYLVTSQISLLAGICSGEMSNAKWLGNALFIRHVNQVLPRKRISYLYWDNEGVISILDPENINPRWNPSNNKITFKIGNDVIPFTFLSPVFVNGNKIESAMSDVLSLFDALTVTWKDALSVYRQAIVDGEKRVSWVNFIQTTIINNPQSISVHNSKIPAKSQRIEVDSRSMIFSWKHPESDWNNAVQSMFKSNLERNSLHSSLMNEKSSDEILQIESNILSKSMLEERELNVRVITLRSYFNLYVHLFQEVSSKSISRSEVSKHCIKSLSNWFTTIQSDLTLFEFSKLDAFSNSRCLSEFVTYGMWEQKFSEAIIDPVSNFMSLHDELLKNADEDYLPSELSSSIKSIVYEIQKEVIVSNNRNPTGATTNQTIRFGSRRELGLNRKGIIISGICKMYFLSCLISISKGGLSK